MLHLPEQCASIHPNIPIDLGRLKLSIESLGAEERILPCLESCLDEGECSHVQTRLSSHVITAEMSGASVRVRIRRSFRNDGLMMQWVV